MDFARKASERPWLSALEELAAGEWERERPRWPRPPRAFNTCHTDSIMEIEAGNTLVFHNGFIKFFDPDHGAARARAITFAPESR